MKTIPAKVGPRKVVELHGVQSLRLSAHMLNEHVDFINLMVKTFIIKSLGDLADDDVSVFVLLANSSDQTSYFWNACCDIVNGYIISASKNYDHIVTFIYHPWRPLVNFLHRSTGTWEATCFDAFMMICHQMSLSPHKWCTNDLDFKFVVIVFTFYDSLFSSFRFRWFAFSFLVTFFLSPVQSFMSGANRLLVSTAAIFFVTHFSLSWVSFDIFLRRDVIFLEFLSAVKRTDFTSFSKAVLLYGRFTKLFRVSELVTDFISESSIWTIFVRNDWISFDIST